MEFNLLVWAVGTQAEANTLSERVRQFQPGFTDERIRTAPGVLIGTPQEIADRVRECRDRYGITYFTIFEWDTETFAPVIELLK
ncbi:hypothetical protein AB0M22_32520 [Nocardia sp. NPDC051756]|uniref:hypothetical protein n=1 Tax=Nocardia sp. NPDC051756 TaxID=3154751 RepID=UPI00341613BB